MKVKSTVLLCVLVIAYYYVEGHKIYCFKGQQDKCSNISCSFTGTSTNISTTTFPNGNFTIQLCSTNFILQSSLSIADKNVTVVIKGMPTKIHCHKNVGIQITRVRDLDLSNIELVSCGALIALSNKTFPYTIMSSLYIFNCTNINITGLSIANSSGNGMTMIDNRGSVVVQNSNFSMNKDNYSFKDSQDVTEVGSGLRIVVTYCHPRYLGDSLECISGDNDDVTGGQYRIAHCNFVSNNDGKIPQKHHTTNGQPFSENSEYLAECFGRGGGLCIVIDRNSRENHIVVESCSFVKNSAIWGGGLYVTIQETSLSNNVEIKSCTFYMNRCDHLGGGGAAIGYHANDKSHPHNNTIRIESCRFMQNSAGFGGGVHFYSSSSYRISNNVSFKNCSWTENVAAIGAAVNMAPPVWMSSISVLRIKVIYTDCTFVSNYLKSDVEFDKSYNRGKGTFSALGYNNILFRGTAIFDNNTGSAMFLTSTEIKFKSNTSIVFSDNRGFEGGAIYMQGSSALILKDDSKLTFVSNTAERVGGAIFQFTNDVRDFFFSRHCFIRYNSNSAKKTATFLFQNNTAGDPKCGRNCSALGQYGHSIYTTTANPCLKSRDCSNNQKQCIANFDIKHSTPYDLSTTGQNLSWDDSIMSNKSELVWAVPGKTTELPIKTLNDFGNEVFAVYHVTVRNKGNGSLFVQNNYTYLFSKSIILCGEPSASGYLTLTTVDPRKNVFTFKVKLQECPPGFIHNSQSQACVCPTHENNISGIRSCDDDKFESTLTSNYWMGYDRKVCSGNDSFGIEKELLYATCPRGQCLNESDKHERLYRVLPPNTSVCSLDEAVCVSSRTGVLCSKCKVGYATHYHDATYSCKSLSHDSCKWGWLLYIVTELIPVTAFFIIIIVLNIKLTDGATNGLVLYFQLSDTMLLRGNGFISYPRYSDIALNVYHLITRIFNLNFFVYDSLSFCMWKSASTLDLLAFKYLTILFSSSLVVIIIAIVRYNGSSKLLVKLKSAGNIQSTKSTIIHGVSGFLVICYSECMQISLLLLYVGTLHSAQSQVERKVSFYNGELDYFQGKHLLYAIPALLIFILFGILPPLLFISYPLCYKVLAVLKLNESRFSKLLCTVIPLEKFKPFFDSFQSSYKNEYRFFSGFYFLYRFTTVLTFSFQGNLTLYYTLVQVQLIAILSIHAVCQPYVKRSHNIIDTLLFMNLSVINILTFFNYHHSLSYSPLTPSINRVSVIQMMLLYLPLVYATSLIVKKMVLFAKEKKITSSVCQKLKCLKRGSQPSENPDGYHRLSRHFTLSAAEIRMRDTVEF